MQKILPWQLVRMRSAVRICPAAPKKFWNRKISGLFLLLWWFFVAQNFRLKLLCWNFQHFFQQSAYLAPAPLSTPISSFAISGFVCSNWNASASVLSIWYLATINRLYSIIGKWWIQGLKLDSRIWCTELPVNSSLNRVPFHLPCSQFRAQFANVVYTAGKALTSHDIQFNFSDVKPTAMFWRIMDFKPLYDPTCFFGRILFV